MLDIKLDVNKWLRELGVAEKNIKKTGEAIFKETADLIYTNTVNWTPVGKPETWSSPPPIDYTPGQLKGSWRLEFESTTSAVLYNPVIYATRIEYGWSRQAPEGMLRRAIALYPKIIEQLGVKYKL